MINEAKLVEPLFIRQVFQTTKIAVKHLCPQAVWALKVMYLLLGSGPPERGLGKPGNPAAKGPERAPAYVLSTCSTLHVEGCALRRVLEEVFERSTAKKRGLGGDPKLKSGRHLLLLLLLQTLHHADRRITYTRKLYVHDKRHLEFSFNGICVIYHGLFICTRAGDFSRMHRVSRRTMGCRRCP